MQGWLPWLLFLHVLGAIVAFGPTFAFSFIGAMGGGEPQHANFATRVSHTIASRLVYPIGITLPITGALMIVVAGINPLAREHRGLAIAIVVYVIAYGYSFFVQRKLVDRVIELTSSPPPPGASGPPPELMATIKRIGQGGMAMGILLVVIIFLMVVKPTI
jgi:hypothetical protein